MGLFLLWSVKKFPRSLGINPFSVVSLANLSSYLAACLFAALRASLRGQKCLMSVKPAHQFQLPWTSPPPNEALPRSLLYGFAGVVWFCILLRSFVSKLL